jgi:hypothetical protein
MSTNTLIIIIIIIVVMGLFPYKYDFFENVRPLMTAPEPKATLPAARTINAPVIFQTQIYPYSPYGHDTGKPCKDGCGALGICENDICQLKPYTKTAFDVTI